MLPGPLEAAASWTHRTRADGNGSLYKSVQKRMEVEREPGSAHGWNPWPCPCPCPWNPTRMSKCIVSWQEQKFILGDYQSSNICVLAGCLSFINRYFLVLNRSLCKTLYVLYLSHPATDCTLMHKQETITIIQWFKNIDFVMMWHLPVCCLYFVNWSPEASWEYRRDEGSWTQPRLPAQEEQPLLSANTHCKDKREALRPGKSFSLNYDLDLKIQHPTWVKGFFRGRICIDFQRRAHRLEQKGCFRLLTAEE